MSMQASELSGIGPGDIGDDLGRTRSNNIHVDDDEEGDERAVSSIAQEVSEEEDIEEKAVEELKTSTIGRWGFPTSFFGRNKDGTISFKRTLINLFKRYQLLYRARWHSQSSLCVCSWPVAILVTLGWLLSGMIIYKIGAGSCFGPCGMYDLTV